MDAMNFVWLKHRHNAVHLRCTICVLLFKRAQITNRNQRETNHRLRSMHPSLSFECELFGDRASISVVQSIIFGECVRFYSTGIVQHLNIHAAQLTKVHFQWLEDISAYLLPLVWAKTVHTGFVHTSFYRLLVTFLLLFFFLLIIIFRSRRPAVDRTSFSPAFISD